MSNYKYIASHPIYVSETVKVYLTAYVSSYSDEKTYNIQMTNSPRTFSTSSVSKFLLGMFFEYVKTKQPNLREIFEPKHYWSNFCAEAKTPEYEKIIQDAAIAVVKIAPEWLATLNITEVVQNKIFGNRSNMMGSVVQKLIFCRKELSRHASKVTDQCKKWQITKGEFAKILSTCDIYDGYPARKLDGLEILSLLKELYPNEQN